MDGEISGQKWDLYLKILSLFVFISLLGAVKPVVFNEGSHVAEYTAKQAQLEIIHESEVEDYMESALFGNGTAKLNTGEDAIDTQSRKEDVTENIFRWDSVIALFLLLGSTLLLWPGILFNRYVYHILIPIALWLFLQAAASTLIGGKKFSELATAAHATRWGLPLVLWTALWMRKSFSADRVWNVSVTLALVCSGLTFAVHGWEALNLNPSFQDLLYNFTGQLGTGMSSDVNSAFLKTVGCMDILLALSLLFVRHPKLFLWMSVWGLVTALSRPLTIGFGAWPEAAMRLANFGMPFFLFVLYRNQPLAKNADSVQNYNHKLESICE